METVFTWGTTLGVFSIIPVLPWLYHWLVCYDRSTVIITLRGVDFMANMSYCRFQNTVEDVEDCLEALKKGILEYGTIQRFKDSLCSSTEALAFEKLFMFCEDLHEIRWGGRVRGKNETTDTVKTG